MKLVDLTGEKFGRLTVKSKAKSARTKSGRSLVSWNCICVCGEQITVLGENLKKGRTKSCGCYAKEKAVFQGKTNNLKHGNNRKSHSTPEYSAWQSMITRCERPKSRGYENYGGRGISVCKEWRESFERFFWDMGIRPSDSHSLDRIDSNGNYEPSNCRWATKTEQSRNVRAAKTNSTGVKGVQKLKSGKYKATIGVNNSSMFLGHFDTIEDATKARKQAEEKYWSDDNGDF
jgi:hypothetical protein